MTWDIDTCPIGTIEITWLPLTIKIQRNRKERNKTGGGEIGEDADLTETDEIFMDFVGVEGVVGK